MKRAFRLLGLAAVIPLHGIECIFVICAREVKYQHGREVKQVFLGGELLTKAMRSAMLGAMPPEPTRPSAKARSGGNLAIRMKGLSDRRQQIIRPVLADPRAYVLMTVREMAAALGTDAATIVRIVGGMGFQNYRDFQHHLHDASIAYATSLDTMRASGKSKSGAGNSFEQDSANLSALRSSIEIQQIAAVARRIHSSRRIVIIGGDLAATLVGFLEYCLALLGLPVFAGTSPGRIAHLTRACNSKDLVIAISFRRGLRMTVEGLQQAREKGAYCVAVSDTLLSPLAKLAHLCFIASAEMPSFSMSYVAPMALLNALLAECANVRRSQTLKLLREVDAEQRAGSRWYPDEPDVS